MAGVSFLYKYIVEGIRVRDFHFHQESMGCGRKTDATQSKGPTFVNSLSPEDRARVPESE